MSGSSERIGGRPRRPSSALSGGMRMSITATSGLCARTLPGARRRRPPGDHVEARVLEQRARCPRAASTASSAITTRMGSPRARAFPRRPGSRTSSSPSSAATRSASPRSPSPGPDRRRRGRRRGPPRRSCPSADRDAHLGLGRLRVAGGVRQRLRHDEVGRASTAAGKRSSGAPRAARPGSCERGDQRRPARAEAALGEHRGMDAARQLAQLGGGLGQVLHRVVEELAPPRVGVPSTSARQAQAQAELHEPLLGAVVEVALEPPPRVVRPPRRSAAREARSSASARLRSVMSRTKPVKRGGPGSLDPRDRQLHRELAAVGAHAGDLDAPVEQRGRGRSSGTAPGRRGGARAGRAARSARPCRGRSPRRPGSRRSARRRG